MKESKTIQINGKQFLFINEAAGTRNGFKHETTLYYNGRELSTGKCIYYNRTWEKYRFQSVMLQSVSNAIQWHESIIENQYKHFFNYNRLTNKRRENIAAWAALNIPDTVNQVNALKELYQAL